MYKIQRCVALPSDRADDNENGEQRNQAQTDLAHSRGWQYSNSYLGFKRLAWSFVETLINRQLVDLKIRPKK